MKKRNTKRTQIRRAEDHEIKVFVFPKPPESVTDQQQTNSVISWWRGVVNQFGELARSIRANFRVTKT